MTSTRRIASLIGACAALMLVVPASASAVVYCVPNTSVHASCEVGNPTVQNALTTAGGTGTVADTVRIGPGTFTEDGLIYFTATSANSVDVIGAGTGLTTLTRTGTTGTTSVLNFQAPAPSSVSDLRVAIPANDITDTDTGLFLVNGVAARRVLIEGGTDNLRGAEMSGATTLDDSTVNLPTGTDATAVKQNGGSPTITDSTLIASIGAEHSGTGSTTTVERSTIRARSRGVTNDSGTIVVRNSVIDLGSNAGAIGVQPANFNNSTSPISATVDGSTIVGGGANSIGVRAQVDSEQLDDPMGMDNSAVTTAELDDAVNNGETATVTVSSTVISGPATAVMVEADRGEIATVTTNYSNYTAPAIEDDDLSNGNATGNATLTEANKTTHAVPGFVNPGAGNYHLLPSSPLLDIGDPAAPPGGSTDIDGNPRALSKTSSCTAPDPGRRDIGADEFVASQSDCTAPNTSISGKRKVKSRKKKARVIFTLTATEAGATFECSIDVGPFRPCVSPFVTKLRRGPHTLTARAKDAGGNVDTSPASFPTRVTKKKPKK